MKSNVIQVRGARTHNLKNVNLDFPVNAITCVAGMSGSGKSSLVFHTLFSESKRRLINSFPTDMKFFWDIPLTADVDRIEPVLPVWGLPQVNPVVGSRPVVSDILGLTEKLQRIFHLLGIDYCPEHGIPLVARSIEEDFQDFLAKYEIVPGSKAHVFLSREDWRVMVEGDISPMRSANDAGEIRSFSEDDDLWELFRFKVGSKAFSLTKKLQENGLSNLKGQLIVISGNQTLSFALSGEKSLYCIEKKCNYSVSGNSVGFEFLSPYNALGACDVCNGYGMRLEYDRELFVQNPGLSINEGAVSFFEYKQFQYLWPYMVNAFKSAKISIEKPFVDLPDKKWKILWDGKGDFPGIRSCLDYLETKKYKKSTRILLSRLQTEIVCEQCGGSRLNMRGRACHLVGEKNENYESLALLTVDEAFVFFKNYINPKNKAQQNVGQLLKEVVEVLETALSLGLGHVRLMRKVRSLSAGEYQRMLLSKFISFKGSGMLFIFDEPSIGLGPNEQKELMKGLTKLKDQGNTVVMVEHSELLQKHSDHIVMMGPGAGDRGGVITYEGSFKKDECSNGNLNEISPGEIPAKRKWLKITGASIWDLQEHTIRFPQDEISWIYGDSGTGKTGIIINVLGNALYEKLRFENFNNFQGKFKSLRVPKDIENVEIFDASLGRVTSRSTVGSYLGIAPILRKKFAGLKVSKELGLVVGHFSSNSGTGKCPSCEGRGIQIIEMQFLEDMELVCDDCQGMKIRPLVATISDGNFKYIDCLNKPVEEIWSAFPHSAKVSRVKSLFSKLNLNHLSLGRPLSSLSGGERLRLKLMVFLTQQIRNSVLIFENISFGLSNFELSRIAGLLGEIRDSGNTIIIIDQNRAFSKLATFSLQFHRDGLVEQA